MKVLVTGAQGALGQDVTELFRTRGHEVMACDRRTLDITKPQVVLEFVLQFGPEVIINCAAYNAVDKAEDPEQYPLAYAINALGPEYLATAARAVQAAFVHVSTDAVFSGSKQEGYTESDERLPICKYGHTKLAGEKRVQHVGGQYYIVRTARLFGRPGVSADAKESFVAMMLRLAATKPELSIIHEEVGCPTYTPDLAEGIYTLIQEAYAPGEYHLVNSGTGVTWFEFAEEVFALAAVTTPRHPVPAATFPKPAARGSFTVLNNTKFPPLRSRLEALRAYLQSQK
jgi:dTDP-4-dehydrorhamnose reductase